jgi:signal transduction histidine kinase
MENEDLKQENEKLKHLISEKTDMVSIVTHQVRTSLSGLKWIIKMFLDGDLGRLTPEQESLLLKAYDSNERSIINLSELLLANRTENSLEKKYVFEKINVMEIIEATIFDFSGEARAKGIEVIILKPENPLTPALADKEKTRIVLQNLIENAIKYSNPHGKVFITIKEITETIQISVKNTGTNISEMGKSKIFEKFYRDPEAEKREITGTGIGLYTVKQIVEKTGGTIWFDSNPTEGTTFFFTLPACKE